MQTTTLFWNKAWKDTQPIFPQTKGFYFIAYVKYIDSTEYFNCYYKKVIPVFFDPETNIWSRVMDPYWDFILDYEDKEINPIWIKAWASFPDFPEGI